MRPKRDCLRFWISLNQARIPSLSAATENPLRTWFAMRNRLPKGKDSKKLLFTPRHDFFSLDAGALNITPWAVTKPGAPAAAIWKRRLPQKL